MHQGKSLTKTYSFDQVFSQDSTQSQVYERAVQPIIREVLEGFNCTVFAYGQTGTGKTYTMEGRPDSKEHRGMIPRAVEDIFAELEARANEYTVKVSFLEIYNEELIDLCAESNDKRLRIFEDASGKRGMLVNNLEEALVQSTDEVLGVLNRAMSHRRVAETKLNKESSRSHCVFTITIHTKEAAPGGEDVIRTGKLHLVDLAGSESVGRSGARQQRAKEAGKINQSLLTLGRVINALVGQRAFVPYRDSKLTRLLQESLGGKSKTLIIATVSPSQLCIDETLSTLEYAHKAKNIKNKPSVNQRVTQKVYIRELNAQISELRRELEVSRTKNGIILPPEKYERLCSEGKELRSRVEALKMTLAAKIQERDHIERDLANTKRSLQETQQSLDAAGNRLRAAETRLDDTERDLTVAQQNLKNQRYVAQVVRKNEAQLASRAQALRQTLEAVISDKDKLHTKEARLQEIEATNEKLANATFEDIVGRLESLGIILNNISQRDNVDAKVVSHKAKEYAMTLESGCNSAAAIREAFSKAQAGRDKRAAAAVQAHKDSLEAAHKAFSAARYNGEERFASITATASSDDDRAHANLQGHIESLTQALASFQLRFAARSAAHTHAITEMNETVARPLEKMRNAAGTQSATVLSGLRDMEKYLQTRVDALVKVLQDDIKLRSNTAAEKRVRAVELVHGYGATSVGRVNAFARVSTERMDGFCKQIRAIVTSHAESERKAEAARAKVVANARGAREVASTRTFDELLENFDRETAADEDRLYRLLESNRSVLQKCASDAAAQLNLRVQEQHTQVMRTVQSLLESHAKSVQDQLEESAQAQATAFAAQKAEFEREIQRVRVHRSQFRAQILTAMREAETGRVQSQVAAESQIEAERDIQRKALVDDTVVCVNAFAASDETRMTQFAATEARVAEQLSSDATKRAKKAKLMQLKEDQENVNLIGSLASEARVAINKRVTGQVDAVLGLKTDVENTAAFIASHVADKSTDEIKAAQSFAEEWKLVGEEIRNHGKSLQSGVTAASCERQRGLQEVCNAIKSERKLTALLFSKCLSSIDAFSLAHESVQTDSANARAMAFGEFASMDLKARREANSHAKYVTETLQDALKAKDALLTSGREVAKTVEAAAKRLKSKFGSYTRTMLTPEKRKFEVPSDFKTSRSDAEIVRSFSQESCSTPTRLSCESEVGISQPDVKDCGYDDKKLTGAKSPTIVQESQGDIESPEQRNTTMTKPKLCPPSGLRRPTAVPLGDATNICSDV